MNITLEELHQIFTCIQAEPPNGPTENRLIGLRSDPCYLVTLIDYLSKSGGNNNNCLLIACIDFKNTIIATWVILFNKISTKELY